MFGGALFKNTYKYVLLFVMSYSEFWRGNILSSKEFCFLFNDARKLKFAMKTFVWINYL